ncbi:MAG: GFA family protein [Acidobacteriota bacterium]|nr:GFA family protein [Acidobacteriota bacterium]MDE2921414.1 GFA family protein [Acidobacteriota bacterium]MDE3264569.1 GFA family protein [Acidobacteriota bacterium]
MSESETAADRLRGQCLCGAVHFEVDVPERTYSVCHCGLCRRWSGGPLMSVHCPEPNTEWLNDEGLTWYQGTPWAQRGFCSKCGSSLFWRLAQEPEGMLIVSVDAIDDAADFALDRHIYSDAKPERYDFADDRPRVTEAELMKELGLG